MRGRAIVRAVGAATIIVLGACAPSSNVRFLRPEAETVWPSPPDPARIRYLGQVASTADLNPERTAGETLGDVLFGKESPVGMVSPVGVCTDGKDRVFIADGGAQVLHVYDMARQRYAQWTPPKDATPFRQPVAAAYDPAGRVLVADALVGGVFSFDDRGTFLGVIGDEALRRPCGLAVRPGTGDIYVADPGAHQVVVLAADGRELSRIGSRGTNPGSFNFPTYVAFDSTGRLYVSDSLNFRVQQFDSTGTFTRQIGSKGDVPGTFSQPKGIAVDPDDHLYVVDSNFEAVQVFDEGGQLLLTFGREGRGPGEFWLPCGANFDSSGRLWIADSFNKRIQVFQYLREGAE